VSAVGLTVAIVPEVTAPTPWSTAPEPLLNTPVRVVLVPRVMGDFAAWKLVMTGSGGGAEPPPPWQANNTMREAIPKARPSRRPGRKEYCMELKLMGAAWKSGSLRWV